MMMAKAFDELVWKTLGKKSYASDAYSQALSEILTIIADNVGLDKE